MNSRTYEYFSSYTFCDDFVNKFLLNTATTYIYIKISTLEFFSAYQLLKKTNFIAIIMIWIISQSTVILKSTENNVSSYTDIQNEN